MDGLKTLSKLGSLIAMKYKILKKIVNMTRQKNSTIDPKCVMYNIEHKTRIKYHIQTSKNLYKLLFVSKVEYA